MRVLVLGGTGEARALARALHDRGDVVVSSLAGRVSNPALPVGEVRVGGFGGIPGLASYLIEGGFDAIVDATHPFADTISGNAAAAAAQTRTPLVLLRRPGWTEQDGDRWTRVPTIEDAAVLAAAHGTGTVFLTTGRRDLAAFATDAAHDYLVRTVEPPDPPTPPRVTALLDRGPYTVEGEGALMDEYGVTLLVTKDSGGPMTSAKLEAARARNLPVVVVDRPAPPAGVPLVESVADAVGWLDAGISESGSGAG